MCMCNVNMHMSHMCMCMCRCDMCDMHIHVSHMSHMCVQTMFDVCHVCSRVQVYYAIQRTLLRLWCEENLQVTAHIRTFLPPPPP
jgi:hypothetical protein